MRVENGGGGAVGCVWTVDVVLAEHVRRARLHDRAEDLHALLSDTLRGVRSAEDARAGKSWLGPFSLRSYRNESGLSELSIGTAWAEVADALGDRLPRRSDVMAVSVAKVELVPGPRALFGFSTRTSVYARR